jgi:threonine/homoserine/homoserine lactone efflux protein
MTSFSIFALAFAASAALPGPEIAALLSRSLATGLSSCLYLAAGITAGKLLMLSAALLGLTALLQVLGPAFVVLKFAGAAYLVWIGVNRWRKAGRMVPIGETLAARPARMEIAVGLAMTVSNPLALAFYMALLPTVIDMEEVTALGYLKLCAIIIGVMVLVVLAYGAIGEMARRMFNSARAKARVDRLSGGIMVGVGCMIAWR